MMMIKSFKSCLYYYGIAFLLMLAAAVLMTIFGCQADPVNLAISGAMKANQTAIRNEAEIGLRAHSDPVCAHALGVPLISAGAADFGKKTLDYQDQMIELLKQHENGTVPTPTIPPVPTP